MPFNIALDARVHLALFRVSQDRGDLLSWAIQLAGECGYQDHPEPYPPCLISSEEKLLTAWHAGWQERAVELLPLTEAEIQAHIDEIMKEALEGCGQFYELYAQKFTRLIDEWLLDLDDGETEIALRLLKGGDYCPDVQAEWRYDHEEGDIYRVGPDSASIAKI